MIKQGISVSLKELIQYHLTAKKLSLHLLQKAASPFAGQYSSSLYGRGLDFAETTAYTPGDDIRTMDWRVLARTGKPHTKRYHEEKERTVYFLVDYNASMFFGTRTTFKSVIAARTTAILAWAACHQHDKVGGIVFSGNQQIELRPNVGKRGVLPLLTQLADIKSAPNPIHDSESFSLALLRLRSVCKPGSLIFILSDFTEFNQTHCVHLTALSRHNKITAYLIRDPLEINPPPMGCYTVSDGQNHQYSFALSNKTQQIAYSNVLTKHHLAVQEEMKKLAIPLINLQTDTDVSSIARR